MSTNQETLNIPLPKGWTKQIRSAVLHVISLAQYAAAYTRGWAADSANARVRRKAEGDRANQELLLLREEIRIKDARLARIDPHRRPHYPPTERMAILQLKAARGWSLEQTARVFQLTAGHGRFLDQAGRRTGAGCLGPNPRASEQIPRFRALRGPATQDTLPCIRQEEARRDTGPRGTASGDDHRGPHAQGETRTASSTSRNKRTRRTAW